MWLPRGFLVVRRRRQRARCRRWQTAKSLHCLFFSVFSYTQPFSQQMDDTYIFFTWQVHSKHMRYPTHIISSYMHSSINHTQQVPHTCIQPYILQQCHPTIHAQFIDTKEPQFIQTSTPSMLASVKRMNSTKWEIRKLEEEDQKKKKKKKMKKKNI